MKWDQIQVSWKQLRDEYLRRWFRVNGDSDKGLELMEAEISSGGQRDAKPTAFRPDDRGTQTEYSLHIGC